MSSNNRAVSLTERKNVIVNNAQDAIINQATSILLGIQGFIEKPFTTKTIEESLSRLIEEYEQRST